MNDINPFDELFEPINHWLRTLPWWEAVAVFIAYAVLLFALQWILFRLLRAAGKKSPSRWPEMVIDAFQSTVLIFLLSGIVTLLPPVLKVPKEWRIYFFDLARLLAALAFAFFIQRLLLAAYRHYVESDESHRTYSGIVKAFITIFVFSIFFMIFLQSAGISITPLIASLGVGSVAVAFALQQTLASLFAGLFLLTDKPIRMGDYVKLETGEEGYVESMGWRSVRIRTPINNIIIVPNSKLVSGTIMNYSLPDRQFTFSVDIGVDYASDLSFVEQVTLEVAREALSEVPGAVAGFNPSVSWTKLDDSAILFNVTLRSMDYAGQAALKNAFIKKIVERYRNEKINIPFPVRTIITQKS